MLVTVAFIPHLIHHTYRIACVGVNRLIQADRVNDGIHGHHYLLPWYAKMGGDLLDSGFSLRAGHQLFPGLKHMVGSIPHTAADPNRTVISQIASNLSNDHRNAVSRKFYILIHIKPVDGFDQSNASHLKQIVHIFAAAQKTLDHG